MTTRRGFTLTELLIVIGVISILSVLTLVSVRAITRDSRVASGINTMSAVLDTARSLAIKTNEPALVVFRPKLDEREQIIEAITAVWTGASYTDNTGNAVIDRFVPSPDVPIRVLPRGIKVAGPAYASALFNGENDYTWVTQTHLPNQPDEARGVLLGIMYAPDGSTISQNSRTDSDFVWVDFDNRLIDGVPRIRRNGTDLLPNPGAVGVFLEMAFPDDEPYVTIAPFLAVYDDERAREGKTLPWDNTPQGRQNYVDELIGPAPNGYISVNADRLHFNRFTGVVMR